MAITSQTNVSEIEKIRSYTYTHLSPKYHMARVRKFLQGTYDLHKTEQIPQEGGLETFD
jgi:hypothetical protein